MKRLVGFGEVRRGGGSTRNLFYGHRSSDVKGI